MSAWTILKVAIEREADVVTVRQRARRIAELLGFDIQDQTRIATAVSEIARNAMSYGGGGRAEFALSGAGHPQRYIIRVFDSGPGVANLATILAGRFKSTTGLGIGMAGARRLMDEFEVETAATSGTTITLGKSLPGRKPALLKPALELISRQLAAEAAGDPLAEATTQNRELLQTLGQLRRGQEEAMRLNEELDKTNKGVVALYAELDHRAVELQHLNASLEQRVATAIAARERAEDHVRQSQKMEAVGQLTGGLAHDFNNLLQVIIGNVDSLVRNLPEDSVRLRRSADNAMLGAQRAAVLTQRLLAFSRRQPLAPKPVDINALVAGMTGLLRQTLGALVEIEVRSVSNLWLVNADANQLENALLNLAVNARDAMASGGTLALETANSVIEQGDAREGIEAAPGEYVSLSVTDTGSGMSAGTMARVFEPFFTTKDVGEGTGLGLSMVYGFVKQSGGHISLTSQQGEGTTVKLYLPRYFGVVQEEAVVAERGRAEGHDGEVILVVEDDDDVRTYSVGALRELGYQVLEAADGAAAQRILERQEKIDLLFTDVVLPGGMNGRQLADVARVSHAGLRLLFTSGYAREAVVHNGRLDADIQMIGKPFTFLDLAAKIREVLDAEPQVLGPSLDR